jgi:hypothetical protein
MFSEQYFCKIEHFALNNDKVVYFLIIANRKDNSICLLKKRYSDMKTFHEKITKIINSYKLNVYLPLFPGRKLFGNTNSDEK